jgi:recombination protein RecA
MKKDETPTLKDAMSDLRKKYGESIVITEEEVIGKTEMIPTGSYAIDNLLGGGIPVGRLLELYGEPSQGKSTISLFFAAQVQKAGGTVAYIDAENAYDSDYAKKIGVDTSKVIISQNETLESAFDVIRTLAETNEVDLIIVDSVASLVPKSEMEEDSKSMLKDTYAVQARLLSKALRIITGPVARSKTSVIFINQTRSKVGVIYGPKETSSGGKALKFYASVRLSVATVDKIKDSKDEVIGSTLKITAVKNKCAFPFKTGTIDLYYGTGIDLEGDTLDYGEKIGVITKTGNTYTYDGEKLGVGRENAKNALKKNPELTEQIRIQINNNEAKNKKNLNPD